jgi:hypothetical protein
LFSGAYANIIGNWCVEHHKKYGTAPQAAIQGHFQEWAATADVTLANAVAAFLTWLSGMYAPVATAYALDVAESLFARAALKRLAASIEAALAGNDPQTGVAAVTEWRQPVITATQGVSVFEDEAAFDAVFADAAEALIQHRGALGQFYAGQLARDSFIGLLAPEKRGKTWWLMDTAVAAMAGGCRVGFFCVGDMSQNQFYKRLLCRMTRTPWWGGVVKVPKQLEFVKEGAVWVPGVSVAERTFAHGVRDNKADAWRSWCQIRDSGKRERLKLHVAPAGTMTPADVGSVVDGWIMGGWVPDVLLIDYADVLAAPPGYRPGDRSVHNAIWEQLRGMSQRYHCCLVTATQADAAGGTAYLLTRQNFAEDKRKLAHATGMVGINQTLFEKDLGIYRHNWVVLREEEYNETHCVYTAGSLKLGAPHILSGWTPKETQVITAPTATAGIL